MEMTDREKVLHGLSSCGNDYGTPNICEVTECPYREIEVSCVHSLAHDAMMLITELLKAQEPRVLTLDEAKEALRNDPVICIEGDGKMIYGLRMDGTDYFTMQTDEIMNLDDLDNEEFAAGYGTVFRMWKR